MDLPQSNNKIPFVIVTAAVIKDDSGRFLLTERPEDKHMGGLWEFPGGKVDAGESLKEALYRELKEELAIKIEILHPLTFAVHEEPERKILLLFYACRIKEGRPIGQEGQELRWVMPNKLSDYKTPPADADLISYLNGKSKYVTSEGKS